MERQMAALRAAIAQLADLEQTLTDADIIPDRIEQIINDLYTELTTRLRKAEMEAWSAIGLPEIPRGKRQ